VLLAIISSSIPSRFPNFCIISLVVRTKAFDFRGVFRVWQRLGMSARDKERGAIYAWQRRTAPIYIYIILQMEKKIVRYATCTTKVLE